MSSVASMADRDSGLVIRGRLRPKGRVKGIIGDARMFSAFVTSLVSERMQHRQQRVVEDLSK